jgi:hypothetical protein
MTPPEQSLLALLSRKRQSLCRHIYGSEPKRATLVVLLVIAIGALTVTVGPALSQSDESPTPVTETNNSTAAPGAQVASAVSTEDTLLRGDMQRRTLNVKLARATSDEQRAAIVATTISTLNGRLDTLETRVQRLQKTRETDRMGTPSPQAEYGSIAAEARMINRTLGRLQTAATELPATQFQAQYTNTTSIERLDERASGLTSNETVTSSPSESTSTTTPTPTTTSVTGNSTAADGSSATDQPAGSTDSTGNESSDTDDDDSNDDDTDDDTGSDDTDDDDDTADSGDSENETGDD